MAATAHNRKTFTGELNEERMPKATPVFCTYVMLNRPSITGTGWPRLNRDAIADFEIRSRKRTMAANPRYPNRDLKFDCIHQDYIQTVCYSPESNSSVVDAE
jgi:hypothetical protein